MYNAAVADKDKQQLHIAWRAGLVKVVCATIGGFFALGAIDLYSSTNYFISFSFWNGH